LLIENKSWLSEIDAEIDALLYLRGEQTDKIEASKTKRRNLSMICDRKAEAKELL
jgi:hypothetical protein